MGLFLAVRSNNDCHPSRSGDKQQPAGVAVERWSYEQMGIDRITTNGMTTAFEISGHLSSPVLVLSHALGASMKMWNPQWNALSKSFRLIRYDTRGHGESSSPSGPYSLDQLGDDLITLLDRLDIHTSVLVGLSMGGMIAQNVGLRFPERFEKLILCDTAAVIPDEAQPLWDDRITRARQLGMSSLVDETMERWFTPKWLSTKPDAINNIRQIMLSTDVAGYCHCGAAIRQLNYLDQLKSVDLPTHIIVGESDASTPVAASRAIHAQIPDSTLSIIPSASHLSNVEQPERFNRLVADAAT